MKTLETNFNDTNIIEPLKKGEFIAPRYLHDRIEEEIILTAALCTPMSYEIQKEAFGLIALNECTNLKNIVRQYRSQIKIHEETTNKTYKIPNALTHDVSNKLTAAAITVQKNDLVEDKAQTHCIETCVTTQQQREIIRHGDVRVPSHWELQISNVERFPLNEISDEYKHIRALFDKMMAQKYTTIIRIERIHNKH
ncbi:unnamed protein product [Rotaria sp. Silwood1]|nr:unnamed protein product [Rotaria sp. Silwood1]